MYVDDEHSTANGWTTKTVTTTCVGCGNKVFSTNRSYPEAIKQQAPAGGDSKADYIGVTTGKKWLLKAGETKEELAKRAGEELKLVE